MGAFLWRGWLRAAVLLFAFHCSPDAANAAKTDVATCGWTLTLRCAVLKRSVYLLAALCRDFCARAPLAYYRRAPSACFRVCWRKATGYTGGKDVAARRRLLHSSQGEGPASISSRCWLVRQRTAWRWALSDLPHLPAFDLNALFVFSGISGLCSPSLCVPFGWEGCMRHTWERQHADETDARCLLRTCLLLLHAGQALLSACACVHLRLAA